MDIGLPDVARAAFVTPRARQLAFRRPLHATPMRYLRRVRLELARADRHCAAAGDGVFAGPGNRVFAGRCAGTEPS